MRDIALLIPRARMPKGVTFTTTFKSIYYLGRPFKDIRSRFAFLRVWNELLVWALVVREQVQPGQECRVLCWLFAAVYT